MNAPVTPRILVEYRFYKTRDADDLDYTAYDAVTPGGSIRNGPGYECRTVGYAEAEPHTHLGRESDWAAFMGRVRSECEYVHLKDDAPPSE